MTRRLLHLGLFALVPVAALMLATVGSAAPGSADLRIVKTDAPDPVLAGTTLTYALEVDNLGPNAATGVTVTDQLPRNVDFVSATASGGQCALKGRKVTCSLGTVPATNPMYATARQVTIAVIPRQVGTVTNTATVKGGEKDPGKGNNRASTTTQVIGPPRTCRGIRATIVGTRGNDVIVGSGGPDVVVSFGGDDTVYAFAGSDLVCAGPGRDYVGGGTAADRIFGAAGADRLVGRGGPDVLRGGAGNDVLKGHRGADRLRGGDGFDRCRGGSGRDVVSGCER